MPDAPDLPADLAARFRAVRVLGEGGFGRVLEVVDRRHERALALKLLALDLADAQLEARFRREARATAGIQSPYVVEVFEHGVATDGGIPYILYELVEGPDLARVLAARGPLRGDTWERVATRVAGALQAAHDAGVVHRDVKPANVFLRGEDHPVLGDFGIARLVDGKTQLTQAGVLLGTPPYMAPELLKGGTPSAASDQFAWAASLVELAGGGGVYGSFETGAIFDALRAGTPPAVPAVIQGSLGPPAAALRRALAPAPADRWPSMRAFAEALADGGAGPEPDAGREVTANLALPARASSDLTRSLAVPPPTPATPSPRAAPVRLAIGAVLVAAFTWGILGGGRAGEPTTTPAPPAAAPARPPATPNAAEVARLRRFERDLAALRDHLPPGAGELQAVLKWPQAAALYPDLIDPRFEELWGRLLASLASLEPGPSSERASHAAFPVLRNVAWATRETRIRRDRAGRQSTLFFLDNRGDAGLPPGFDPEVFDNADAVLRDLSADAICALERRDLGASPGLAASACVLAAALNEFTVGAGRAECGGGLAERAGRCTTIFTREVEGRRGEEVLIPLLTLATLVHRVGDSGLLDPGAASRALDVLLEGLEAMPELAPVTRFDLRRRLGVLAFRFLFLYARHEPTREAARARRILDDVLREHPEPGRGARALLEQLETIQSDYEILYPEGLLGPSAILEELRARAG